jgi:hypothetical protein
MGRRYLCTLLMIWFERLLILDDLMRENVEQSPLTGTTPTADADPSSSRTAPQK